MVKHPEWTFLNPNANYEHLGYLPMFLDEDDPANAVSQLHNNYSHGGGWHSFMGHGFKSVPAIGEYAIQFPDDPPYKAIAKCQLRDETIVFYPHAWVGIWHGDKMVDIARMD